MLVKESRTKEWELPPEGLLHLTSSHGNIQIVGTDEPKVHLEIEKLVWAEDEAIARSWLDQLSLEDRQEDHRLFLKVRTPRTIVFGPSSRFEINLYLRVPRTLRIEADHSFGNATIERTGPLQLSHEHGNVEILEVKEADIEKDFGNLRLQKAEGRVLLRGEHGNRRLLAIEGDITAETDFGELYIENPGGAITVRHSHGPVTLRYTHPPSGPLQVLNAHGPVTVEFPSHSSVALNLRVSHGSVTGIGPIGRLATGHQVVQSVILGDGQWPATIEVEHGPVHIRSEADVRVSTQGTTEESDQRREREQALRKERLIILRLLQEGKITPEEAEALLNALEERPQAGKTTAQEESPGSDWQQRFRSHMDQVMREWEQRMKDWQQHFDPGEFINQFLSQIQIDPLINNISRFAETLGKNLEEWLSDLSAGERVEALREEVIPLDPDTSSLEVILPQGRIEASPGPSQQVKILLRARGKDQETAHERLQQTHLACTPGPKASIRVESPPEISHSLFAEVQVSLPEDRTLILKQKKGAINLREIKGEVIIEQAEGHFVLTDGEALFEVKNASGSITLMRVKGKGKIVAVNSEIEIKDYEGPIEIEIAQGKVELERLKAGSEDQVRVKSGNAEVEGEDIEVPQLLVETVSAPIRLERVKGDLTLKTLKGTVVAKNLSGEKMEVQSSEGDIHLSFKDPFSGNLRAETLTGKIRVRLPQDSNVSLQLLSGAGQIIAPAEITLLEQTPQYLKGVLGDGQGQIALRSATGAITLELE